MKQANEKYTILYARLSQDDGSQGDSNSILNQRLMLQKFAKDNHFENTKFLYDDGATGTNFNRPAFQEVMTLIENGEVATLIVKDMSRLGREYLEFGRLTEIVFPSYSVRFIAMNDGVDSLYGDNEFTPFKNLINEWYAKDCSKKGKVSARIKAESGARVGSRPPFGYRKDPADPKRKIVPDEETAPIVQNIFSGLIYCKGCGGTMVLHRAHTMDAVKNNFMCSVCKKKGKENCSAHYIRESQLAEIILDDLRRVTHYARQHEFLFAKHITQKNSAEIRREIAQTERELENLKRRDCELKTLIKRLYEDNVLGKIPSEVFRKLSDDYLTEQKEIQTTIPKKESSLERLKDSVSNVSAFIDKAKQYTEIKELTAELLHLFIERVEVGERTEKWSRTAIQEINIYYRDIGLLDNVIDPQEEQDASQAPIEVT